MEGQQLLSQHNDNTVRSSTERLQSTSAPPFRVFGQDSDLKMIRSMLHDTQTAASSSRPTKCYSVIGIHGIPGSGKTTLAQSVCQKEREDPNHYFDLIMWIHVSQYFSVEALTSEMLETASGRQSTQLSNLDNLQEELREKLKGKRFFLVMDDVWYDKGISEQKLDLLLRPLEAGEMGSRILVTTRTADAARALGDPKPTLISDLSEEEYMSMFMYYALGDEIISDKAYQLVGGEIAKKLRRSPLAAITVAGQLKLRREIDFWLSTMQSDLLNDTMGALWWSYQQFDEHIKRCFAFCSLFPRRYQLKKDELVHLWVAEGFMNTANAGKDMEDVGNDYFNELLSRSFIQRVQGYNSEEYYTIHDLLHDLAGRVAGSDCFTVESGMVGQIPHDVRHLFIGSCDSRMFTNEISELRALRTIVMMYSPHGMAAQDLKSIFRKQNKLRVVDVGVEQSFDDLPLPECIGHSKHLRYLRISWCNSSKLTLPANFTKLYNLQELSVPRYVTVHCSHNQEMATLVNLRRARFSVWEFPGIGRMTCLETLRHFVVRKKEGYEIQQLKHLNRLRGTLTIHGLDYVKSKEDACQANLSKKVHVSDLTLGWLRSTELCDQSPDSQEEVIEALRPPFLISSLTIWGYSGSTYPSWLTGEQSTLEKLEYLNFSYCNGCDGPPRISSVNLHELLILGCSWNSLPENMECLTSLQSLRIEGCRNVRSLPRLPPSLNRLSLVSGISDCTWTSLLESMEGLTSLEELAISECENILSLRRFPSLKKLHINWWHGSDAPSMVSEYFPCLHELQIANCNWKSLPENMESLTSLKTLAIKDCNSMLSLPILPKSLGNFIAF